MDHPIISIWFSGRNDTIRKRFHCPNCGKTVFWHYGSHIQLTDGRGEFQVPPKEILCKGVIQQANGDERKGHCNTIFRIE